jgi:hypothetical protein
MPLADGSLKQFFNLGHREAVVEMPGPNASLRIANARPTFCVRGLSPDSGLFLVRSTPKRGYRELRADVSGNIEQWANFRAQDLSDLEMESIDSNVMRVKPSADLKPGEYVLVSDLEPGHRAIHLGFEFSIVSASARP